MAAEEGALTFGLLLRRHRLAAGLTQEQLAERAGVSRRAIDDLERGVRRMPYRDTVRRLAAGLGLSAEDAARLGAAVIRAHGQLVVLNPRVLTSADGAATLSPRLPAPLTSLVGREREVAALTALLRRDGVRLVTITGPGGIGKTRLSLRVAADVQDAFADGAWLIRLSRISDPALVISSIARAFDLKGRAGTPLDVVLHEHLRERRLLLVLDNFEHLVTAAESLATLLESCAGVKALVTSRIALHLRGEHHYALQPLALPDPAHLPAPEQLAQFPAVALFIERAQAVRAEAVLSEATIPAVAEICARLDGLPLAIELAAARIRLLPPPALLKRMALALPLLRGGARDLDARQQTMRSTLAWSYDLLAPAERRLFRRLAVFAGGWSLEAAEAVCAAPEGAEPLGMDVLSGLESLLDQSLLQQREEEGAARFGMLHVIREFAVEQLEASSELEALRRAHVAYVLGLVERAESELTASDAMEWLAVLDREYDNVRAALGWSRERGWAETGLRLVAGIWRYCETRGLLREGRAWLEALVALHPRDARGEAQLVRRMGVEHRARALLGCGRLAVWQGDARAARSWLEQAAELGRAERDRQTEAYARNFLGILAMHQGDWQWAASNLEMSRDLMRAEGDRRGMAVVLVNLGIVAAGQDDLERATACCTEALKSARLAGDRGSIALAMANLGEAARRHGESSQAEVLEREALTINQELGDPRRCAEVLELLARTAGTSGREYRAAQLLGAATSVREVLGSPPPPRELADTEQAVAGARARLGEEAWLAAYAAGRALSLDEAVAEVLRASE